MCDHQGWLVSTTGTIQSSWTLYTLLAGTQGLSSLNNQSLPACWAHSSLGNASGQSLNFQKALPCFVLAAHWPANGRLCCIMSCNGTTFVVGQCPGQPLWASLPPLTVLLTSIQNYGMIMSLLGGHAEIPTSVMHQFKCRSEY